MDSNNIQPQKPTDWASSQPQPKDWTSSQPKVIADYTKMEDDYGREIDRLAKEGKLTNEQFATYTNDYCWYCGRPFAAIDGARRIRAVRLQKEETKSDGVKRTRTTYTRTVNVPECSECKAFHEVDDKKMGKVGNAAFIVGYLIVAGVLTYLCISTGETATVLIIGIMASLALYMLVGLVGMLVIWPFKALYELITHEKEKNPKPKLRSEEDVPLVKQAHKAGFY